MNRSRGFAHTPSTASRPFRFRSFVSFGQKEFPDARRRTRSCGAKTGMPRPASAFTLIELLVVIAIIGILSAVVLTSLNVARAKARNAERYADMHSVTQALELYANDNNGTYPVSSSDAACGGDFGCITNLQILVTNGYLSALPQDPTQAGTADNYRYCSDVSSEPRHFVLLVCPENTSSNQCCFVPTGSSVSDTICASAWGSYQNCAN